MISLFKNVFVAVLVFPSLAWAELSLIEEREATRLALVEVRDEITKERLLLGSKVTEAEVELLELREGARLARMEMASRKELFQESERTMLEFEAYLADLSSSARGYHFGRVGFLFPGEPSSEWNNSEPVEDQLSVIGEGLDRLEKLMGGGTVEGRAVDSEGVIKDGRFFVLGPAVWFRSGDGETKGAVERSAARGSVAIVPGEVSTDLFKGEEVLAEVDVTNGKARALAEMNQSAIELFQKGGVWVLPIMFIALVSALCGVMKLIQLGRVKEPKPTWVTDMLAAIRSNDYDKAASVAQEPKHPAAVVILSALEYIDSGPEVVEEVIYEQLITVESKMQKWLPFIAITAATAPLLGLLGTVSGMIRTFNVITVAGTGDAKPLAGGISEALVTTLFGLIVAIPALILHSLLSRRSTGIVQVTEKLGLAFVNGLRKK